MTDVKIEIKNIAEIRRAFSKAPRLMGEAFKGALGSSAKWLQRESQLLTPVKTGTLYSSYKTDISGSGLQMKAEVGPSANYGIFVHEGTRFMKGRPFLKQGAEASLSEVDAQFTRAVQNVFDRIGREV